MTHQGPTATVVSPVLRFTALPTQATAGDPRVTLLKARRSSENTAQPNWSPGTAAPPVKEWLTVTVGDCWLWFQKIGYVQSYNCVYIYIYLSIGVYKTKGIQYDSE